MLTDGAVNRLAIGQTLAWGAIYYIFPALLLRWEADLGWSKIDLTTAITLSVLVSAAFSPLTGWIIDRGKGAHMLAASSALGGVTVAGLSFVETLWQFYVLWAIIGVAMSGALYEPCFALVTRNRGEKAKQAIVVITLAAGFASTICFPVAHVLSDHFGWRTTAVVFGAVVVFVVAPLLWTGGNALEKEAQAKAHLQPVEQEERRSAFLSNPAFWCLAFGFAFLSVAHGASLNHFLPILDERGLSADMAVFAASLIGPMQVAGRIAMVSVERYVSLPGLAVTAFTMIGASLLVLQFGGASLPMVVVFVVLFASAYGSISILRPLLARLILGGENFGAKSGVIALPYLAGSALSPLLGAVLWSWGGYELMLTVLFGFVLLGGGLYVVAHKTSHRQSGSIAQGF